MTVHVTGDARTVPISEPTLRAVRNDLTLAGLPNQDLPDTFVHKMHPFAYWQTRTTGIRS